MSKKEHKKKDYLKHRAEQLLKNKDKLNPDIYSKNLEELIENLQVYQFELEIQNEELKRLQLDLESSHKRFQTLFEHAPIGYCTLNMEGTILQTNAAFRAMVDEPSSVLKKKKLRVFIHPDSQDDFYFHLKKVNENSDNHTSRITFKGANNIVHTNFRTRVTSFDNEQEKVIICAINDITREIIYQKKLHESEEKFRSLVDSMNDVIFTIDKNLKHSGLFGRWVILNNNKPEDFLGKTAVEVLGPDMGSFHEKHFKEAFKGNHVVYDWSYMTENGRKYIQTSLSPIYNEHGNVVEIVGAGRDISNARRSHNELHERVKEQTCLYEISKTLQKTDFQLSKTMQQCVEIIPKGFQYPEYAMAKIKLDDLCYFSSKSFEPCKHSLKSEIFLDETNKLEIFVCLQEASQNSPNHSFDFLDEEQKMLDAISENMAKAIENIRTREKLDEKNEKLKKLNAEKDRLFSIIAHDLRSPFSSIMGLINIMEERFDNLSKDAMQQMIQAINKSTGSLFTLLENLLEWSRLQRGQTKTRPSLRKASEIVEEAINTNNSTFVGKDITIKQNIDPDITINVDKTSIISVFNNLLSNAVKFTERGGIITISAQKSQEEVKFSICDTGIGMNESMQKTLFDVDADVKREGTEHEPSSGLGLLISKEFVELNEGNIWVESKENEGSCFYFTLPCPKPK